MTSAPVGPVNTSTAVTAARTILTRLHDVMASRQNAQAKLNTVVEVIGESLHSRSARSISCARDARTLRDARAGPGSRACHPHGHRRGLVGSIAARNETLNLAEAAAHPDFSYRPETGEDRFHSFAGVPIVRRERSVGILCVQHVDPRR
jgi:phosphotransferase system enzyme I (PtsP)